MNEAVSRSIDVARLPVVWLFVFLPWLFVPPNGDAASPLKAVVFDVEPVELPQTAAMRDRLKAESDLLRKIIADKGYAIVDMAPQARKIADNLPLSQCNGCDQDIAKALGADIEVTTAMQQVASAIFNLSGSIKDVATNRVLRSSVVDIHGDDVDVWTHGIKFLVKERLLDPRLPADAAGLKAMIAKAPKPEE